MFINASVLYVTGFEVTATQAPQLLMLPVIKLSIRPPPH